MAKTTGSEAVPTFLVTVVECYTVEAPTEADAIDQVKDLRPSTRADTVAIQIEQVVR